MSTRVVGRSTNEVEPATLGGLDVGLGGEQGSTRRDVHPGVVHHLHPRFGCLTFGYDVGVFCVVVGLAFDQPVVAVGIDRDEVGVVLAAGPLNTGGPVRVSATTT